MISIDSGIHRFIRLLIGIYQFYWMLSFSNPHDCLHVLSYLCFCRFYSITNRVSRCLVDSITHGLSYFLLLACVAFKLLAVKTAARTLETRNSQLTAAATKALTKTTITDGMPGIKTENRVILLRQSWRGVNTVISPANPTELWGNKRDLLLLLLLLTVAAARKLYAVFQSVSNISECAKYVGLVRKLAVLKVLFKE